MRAGRYCRRMADGRDKSGRFTEGHKHATGRPPGARNKPYDNGVHPFLEEDGRLAPARRFRSLITRMVEDLGGEGALSTGQQQLVRRCAMISVQCELMEQAAVHGEDFDLAADGELTDRLGRTL